MSVTFFVNDVGDLIRMLPRNFVANVRNRAWRTQTSVSADSRVVPCLRTQTQTQTRFKFKTADTDADADTLKIKIADTYADVDTLKNRIADTDADTLKY